MTQILLIVILAIWLVGTCIRIYTQARFFQIEEYMTGRYLRWYFQKWGRIFPRRAMLAWFIGSALAVFLGEAPDSLLPEILIILASIIAVIPASEGEVKKKFIRTQRATRLLAASFALATLTAFIAWLILTALPLGNISVVEPVVTSFAGMLLFLGAFLFLIMGNWLMQPVESLIRRRFLNQAKNVMQAIHPKVVGITGSYGKTTTKHFLDAILSSRYKVYATPKSYNTLMGISLAINRDMADDYSIEYFLSEMGAYVPGEIARICQLTPPDIGVVIEVGPQHLERFGTLENTAIAKYELIAQLPKNGLGVFNWDNEFVREMYNKGYPDHRIAVSKTLTIENAQSENVRFVATEIDESLNSLSFTVTDTLHGNSEHFQTSVIGEHNITNILLATAVAVNEGLSLKEIALRVRTLQPAESRLESKTTASGITIINDAYSANPKGVISALKVLGMHKEGKRLLITPGMIELGELQESENFKLGQQAINYATDIVLVGKEQTKPIADGIRSTDFPQDNLKVVDTLSEAVEWYQIYLTAGDTVLFLNDLPDTY